MGQIFLWPTMGVTRRMSDPKKKIEQEVGDNELESDLEFSATTAVMDLSKDIKKALAQGQGSPAPSGQKNPPTPTMIKNGKPYVPSPNENLPKTNPSIRPPAQPSVPKPQAPTPTPPASDIEKVIELQVMRAISKMGQFLPSSSSPALSNDPDLERKMQLEIFKITENINREHSQRNKDLEMEIYSILRKYANHPDFGQDFDRIMQLLSDHSQIEKKFKKTG